MSNKLVLFAFALFLSMVVVGGFVRLVAAEEGNGKVETIKLVDGSWTGPTDGFKICIEDPDGISSWTVYQYGGGSMGNTYEHPYPTNVSSNPLFMAETEFPLKIEVEDGDSDVEWWKVYSDMSTEGAFRDAECTDLIPEFPSFLVLSLFAIVTLFVVLIHKKKRTCFVKSFFLNLFQSRSSRTANIHVSVFFGLS